MDPKSMSLSRSAPCSPAKPTVLSWLDRQGFCRAFQRCPEFARWRDYHEFLLERDALFIGFGAAGVSAKLQPVRFDAFERWSLLTGAPLDIDGLDAFATHWRWRARHPRAAVIGRLGGPGDPSEDVASADSAQIVLIRPEVFQRFQQGFAKSGLLPAPSLDVYATLAVECCMPRIKPVRRPSVSFA
jgi:hypothetical protein